MFNTRKYYVQQQQPATQKEVQTNFFFFFSLFPFHFHIGQFIVNCVAYVCLFTSTHMHLDHSLKI